MHGNMADTRTFDSNFVAYQDFEQLAKTASKFIAAVEWKFTAGRVTEFIYSADQ